MAGRPPCKREELGSIPGAGSMPARPRWRGAALVRRTGGFDSRRRLHGPFVYRQDTGLSRRQGGFDSRTGHYLRFRLRRLPGMRLSILGQTGRAANRTSAS
jgi:hypothetical protein